MAIDYTTVNSNQLWFPVLPSTARTATPNQQQFQLLGDVNSLVLVVDMTAVTATGTVTVKIETVDPVSQKVRTIITSAALSAAATTWLRVNENIPTTVTTGYDVVAQDIVPPFIRVTATHGNGVSMTYSVTAITTD